jgi:hypothetical protein
LIVHFSIKKKKTHHEKDNFNLQTEIMFVVIYFRLCEQQEKKKHCTSTETNEK